MLTEARNDGDEQGMELSPVDEQSHEKYAAEEEVSLYRHGERTLQRYEDYANEQPCLVGLFSKAFRWFHITMITIGGAMGCYSLILCYYVLKAVVNQRAGVEITANEFYI